MAIRLNKKATEIRRPLKRLRDTSNPARVSAFQMLEFVMNNVMVNDPEIETKIISFLTTIYGELAQSKKTYLI